MPKSYKKEAIKGYKKQHGLHHKINKKYGQVYWPYLPVLLLTVLGVSLGIFLTSQTPKPSTISYSSLVSSINNYRSLNGLSRLTLDQNLSTAAQIQANQIAISDSWSPLSKSQTPAFSFISHDGSNLSLPTENLAYGFSSSSSVLSAWASSNYQKTNMLSSNSNSVGYGIVDATDFMGLKNQKIIVAIFADNKTLSPATVSTITPRSINLSDSPQSIAVIRLNSIVKYNDTYELYILAGVLVVLGIVIFSKHTYLIHKWATEGEDLISKHPLLDIALVGIFVILSGAIQTRGYIS
jgi:uncharacterized protein YkwD